jgi:hypothetical protein
MLAVVLLALLVLATHPMGAVVVCRNAITAAREAGR